jgi:RNA polymerase sigma factor (sigma-70 family)
MQTAPSPQRLVVDHLSYAEALTVEVIDQLNLRPLINLDEALSFANTALTEAAHRYQPRVGRTGQAVSFTTFSFKCIRGAVIDGVRRTRAGRHEHELSRQARAALEKRTVPQPHDYVTRPKDRHWVGAENHSDYDHPADATSQSPAFARETEHVLHKETVDALGRRDAVLKAIRQLPEIEQQVVFLHFYEDMSCEQLALRLGISGSYAQRLCKKALRSLRESLKDLDIIDVEGALQ